jgi:hypothetical protein
MAEFPICGIIGGEEMEISPVLSRKKGIILPFRRSGTKMSGITLDRIQHPDCFRLYSAVYSRWLDLR